MDELDKMYLDRYLHPEDKTKADSKIVAKLLKKLRISYIFKLIGVILVFLGLGTLGLMYFYISYFNYTLVKVLLFILFIFIFIIIGGIFSFESFICDRVSKNELGCINIHYANVWYAQVTDDIITGLSEVAKAFSSKKNKKLIGSGVSVFHKVNVFNMRKEIVYGPNLELLKAGVDIKQYNGRKAINSNAAVLATFIVSLIVVILIALIDYIPQIDIPSFVYLIALIVATVASSLTSLNDFIQMMKYLNTSIQQLNDKAKEENK